MHTTLAELRDAVLRFRDDRDWRQFHRPKDLAVGLSIEASELCELFLWKRDAEIEASLGDAFMRERIGEELADVLAFLLYLSDATGTDLVAALHDKLRKNAAKYPVEAARGSAKKYDA